MTRSQAPFSFEFILLGLINEEPIHGYDLYKKVDSTECISLIWHVKQSLLYSMLEKLEEVDFLTSDILDGMKLIKRKEYRITETGRKELLNWVSSPVTHERNIRQEFLAKLYFAQKIDKKKCLALLEAQKTLCETWVVNLEDVSSKNNNTQRYETLIIQYRISQIRATIEWLDYCQKEISGMHVQLG